MQGEFNKPNHQNDLFDAINKSQIARYTVIKYGVLDSMFDQINISIGDTVNA